MQSLMKHGLLAQDRKSQENNKLDKPSNNHSLASSIRRQTIWPDTPSPFNDMAPMDLKSIQNLFSSKAAQDEKKKAIIETTFNRILWRGLIHLLPVSVSIFLIAMNLKDWNIGPDLIFLSWTTTNSLAALQLAAKIQVCRIYDFVNFKGLITSSGTPGSRQHDHRSLRSHPPPAPVWRRLTAGHIRLQLYFLEIRILVGGNLDLASKQIWSLAKSLRSVLSPTHRGACIGYWAC